MNRIDFLPDPQPIRYAVAASFDMSGFSQFCRRPDTHAHLARYLAQLFGGLDLAFKNFLRDLFQESSGRVQVPRPNFMKYTGDGAILLWIKNTGEDFSTELCTSIVASLRHFQQQLPAQVTEWERQWRTTSLPRKARFGISTGPVHPLAKQGTTLAPEIVDYAGYCINLAVRLQDHFPEIVFIIHGPLHPGLEGLVKATALR